MWMLKLGNHYASLFGWQEFMFFLSFEATEAVRDTQPWLGDKTMTFILFHVLLLADSF
jgi:hypothetical protein